MNKDPYKTSRIMMRLCEADTNLLAALQLLYGTTLHSEAIEQELLAVRSSITAIATKLNKTQDGSQPAS